MKEEQFQIIDDNSVIYSSSDYEEAIRWWDVITGDNPEDITWEGDLKLIKILDIIEYYIPF